MARLFLCCDWKTLPALPVHSQFNLNSTHKIGEQQRGSTLIPFATKSFSLNSIGKRCQKCAGKGAIECPGCKGTGKNKKNGNIFERWNTSSEMSNLDKSLDDIIKMNKNSGGSNPRGRARNSGPGPSRRFQNRTANRMAPYSNANVQAPDTKWQHDMFTDNVAAYAVPVARVSAIETGTKLVISNLEYGVSDEDVKELFAEVGDLKRYSIHYDRSGRSKGTAEVVFSRRIDAEAAVKRYNNVQLDGKPMKIEIVGRNIATPAFVPPATNVMFGTQTGVPRSRGRVGAMGGFNGGSRGVRTRGRGRGRGEKVSAEDLDADLDKYHTEAMQTN